LDRTHELEEQVQRLTGEVDEMRARMARLESGEPGQQNGTEPKSRRGFLKIGAGAVLGALGMAAAKVMPAAAATGGPTLLGNANLADAPTTIQTTGTAPRVIGAMALGFTQAQLDAAGTFNAPLQGLGATSGTVEGVNGWAQGASSYGVYGLTDGGTGVVGESNTGIGLFARRSGRIRQEGRPAGAPNYAPSNFEQVRDANGILWIHSATGTAPSMWRRVNSARFDTADGTGGFFKPFRLIDTRSGAAKPGNSTTTVTVAGRGTGPSLIPADAIAIAGNLTAVGYDQAGFLALIPAGVTYTPSSDPSSVNFITGQGAIANSFICGLGAGGAVQVFVATPGATHFIIDITGYFQ
jgi:hypothetical protein